MPRTNVGCCWTPWATSVEKTAQALGLRVSTEYTAKDKIPSAQERTSESGQQRLVDRETRRLCLKINDSAIKTASNSGSMLSRNTFRPFSLQNLPASTPILNMRPRHYGKIYRYIVPNPLGPRVTAQGRRKSAAPLLYICLTISDVFIRYETE